MGAAAAPTPANAPAPAPVSGRLLSEEEAERRLQGTVNVEYEIEVENMGDSAQMMSSLQAADGASALQAAINAELPADLAVEVTEIVAEPEVTISYEIRTTDAAAASTAQAAMAAATAGGADQDALLSGITSNLLDAGFNVTISSMSGTVEEVATVAQGEAAPSRTPTSGAFRLSLRDLLATAVIVAAAVKF